MTEEAKKPSNDSEISIRKPDKQKGIAVTKLTESSSFSSSSEDLELLPVKVSSKSNPFIDPDVANYYRKLYNESKYESRHAFDPNFSWTPEEERKVKLKIDLRVALAACFMFVALQVDRGNLVQAVSDGMLKDLKMTTNDYNAGNQIFYASFLVAELPSQLISKKLGPDIFIPIQMILWSAVSMSQAALTNKTGFFITRCLIGLLEGGFISDLILWLSYFYTSGELSIRLSWFWTSLSLTQIVTALLAFALLRMRGINGWGGWQWLFLIEGIFTFLIGVLGFYLMVPSVVQTKNWMHPKGWFTEREERIIVNKVLRDDPSKGDMNNRKAITPRDLWIALKDYDLWPIYAIGLLGFIPYYTLSAYLTLNLKQLGFGTFNVQLLTIPNYVLHIITLLLITWISEKLKERSYVSLAAPIWSTILLGLIRWWPGSLKNAWGTYAITILFLGQPYIHAICVSWVSRNSSSVRSRAISSALYNMFAQLGVICSSQIYRADDLPLYHRGNLQLFIISLALIPLLFLTKFYYKARNKRKEEIWKSMSDKERTEYLTGSKDQGNKRLTFIFAH